jgi:hypothetical protein
MRHAAARKEVCAAGSGPRLGSWQLFCTHMAKRPPATHEGSHLLVVRTSSDAEPDAGCRSAGCATAESDDQQELADRGEAIALSRRLPTGMLVAFVNRPLFAWSRRASGRPRDDATHVAGDRRRMPAPSQFRPWLGFKRLTTLGFPRRFPIVQFPNAPLIIAFLAGEAAAHIHGSSHAYAWAVSYLAIIIWAYEELVNGVNWFRHLLGLAYVIFLVVRVAHGLQA